MSRIAPVLCLLLAAVVISAIWIRSATSPDGAQEPSAIDLARDRPAYEPPESEAPPAPVAGSEVRPDARDEEAPTGSPVTEEDDRTVDGAILRFAALDARTREAGASLRASSRDGAEGLLGTLSSGESLGDGVLEYRGLQVANVDEGAALRLEAPGYAFYEMGGVEVAPEGVTDLGSILLEPAPVLTVRVVDESSQPIPEARVEVRGFPGRLLAPDRFRSAKCASCHGGPGEDRRPEASGGRRGTCYPLYQQRVFQSFSRDAESDSSGSARVELLPGSRLQGAVSHPDYVDVAFDASEYEDGDEIEIRMAGGGTVVVRVLDADGSPRPGATVTCDGGDPRKTDGQGRVRFEQLTPGRHSFAATRQSVVEPSFVIGEAPPPEGVPGEAYVRAGGEEEIVLQLDAAGGVLGLVLEDGAPLTGASVRLKKPAAPGAMVFGGGQEDASLSTRTDEEGIFRLDDLEPGRYELTVAHPDRVMPARLAIELGVGENRVEIELSVAILRGTVLDADGRPVEGARVRADGATASAAQPMGVSLMTVNPDGTVEEAPTGRPDTAAVSGPDGRFELRGVVPGSDLMLLAEASGGRSGKLRLEPLGADEIRANLEVIVRASCSLRVSLSTGNGGFTEAFPSIGLQRIVDGLPVGEERRVRGTMGFAVIEDLEPGDWAVRGYPRTGGETEAQTVTLVAGASKQVALLP